jgi:hypothetical protein
MAAMLQSPEHCSLVRLGRQHHDAAILSLTGKMV